jgi:hypothetical protein
MPPGEFVKEGPIEAGPKVKPQKGHRPTLNYFILEVSDLAKGL